MRFATTTLLDIPAGPMHIEELRQHLPACCVNEAAFEEVNRRITAVVECFKVCTQKSLDLTDLLFQIQADPNDKYAMLVWPQQNRSTELYALIDLQISANERLLSAPRMALDNRRPA